MSVLQQAIELSMNLLEKVSVLVSTALVLVLLRPADVWLSETGRMASRRRRLVILAVFTPLAIWGIFLGFEIDGLGFNTRSVGIIVAGFLGGRRVGSLVGVVAGVVYALVMPDDLAWFVFAASIIDGGVAGLVARYFGVNLRSVVFGAIAAQLAHHIALGAVLFALDMDAALQIASNVPLHTAKITANTIGVVLFMSVLTLARDLQLARDDARASRAMARSARLEALQYQLQPHFLFNLLNTLAYLIRVEPIKARQLTLDLADFLRYTLSQRDDETTLRAEFEQLARYVELERARFGDGLVFELPEEIDEEIEDALTLPPLILQPLVENAIKHGSSAEGKVCIRVELEPLSGADHQALLEAERARQQRRPGAWMAHQIEALSWPKKRVWIRVIDDGPGLGAEEPTRRIVSTEGQEKTRGREESLDTHRRDRQHRSVGLENVAERLARYYDEEVTLTLRNREDGERGAVAEFAAPLKKH